MSLLQTFMRVCMICLNITLSKLYPYLIHMKKKILLAGAILAMLALAGFRLHEIANQTTVVSEARPVRVESFNH